MGKRLAALSIVAALVAWPVWGQNDGSVILEQETPPPPPAQTSAVETPVEQTPADQTPVDQTPVAKTPVSSEDPSETPPEIVPILPIGDEALPTTVPDPNLPPDPDNAIGDCRPDTLYVRGDFGKARFTVDVAKSSEERAKGLMHVESMPTSKGMLFVYPVPQPVAFWMKNTLIPLDMIFADSRGVVVNVHSNAEPGDLTSIPGGNDVQFVLEINGGLAKMLGIGEGAELRHPAIRRGAWPC